MIKARIRWCSCRVENILTLGKLLRLWFCFLLHSILFFYISNLLSYIQNNFSYELARPIMGTIFLVLLMTKSPIFKIINYKTHDSARLKVVLNPQMNSFLLECDGVFTKIN